MKMNRSNSPNQICFSVTLLSILDAATENLSFPPIQNPNFHLLKGTRGVLSKVTYRYLYFDCLKKFFTNRNRDDNTAKTMKNTMNPHRPIAAS
jgi:hypothetical protein